MAGLPDAVQKAADEADEALEAINNIRETETPALELDQLEQTSEQEPETLEPVGGSETEQASGQEEETQTPPAVDWEQRYKTLQGKYNAEVPTLQNQVSELSGQVQGMLTTAQRPVEQPAEPTQPTPVSKDAFKKYLTDEEKDEYSDDTLLTQARVAQGVVEEVLSAAQPSTAPDEISQRVEELEQKTQQASDAVFWSQVEATAPGARALNDDPLFSEFLNTVEPNSGISYRDLGQLAMERGDAARVAAVFNTYQTPNVESEAPEKPAPKVKPDQGSSRPAPPKASKDYYRKSQMEKFYSDVARGKYVGREAEREKLDEVITAAVQEGRIIPG